MIHVAARGRELFGALDFEDYFALGSELVKQSRDGSRRTAAFERGGRRFYVKTHGGPGWRELWKNWLQLKSPIVDAGTEARALLRGEQGGLPFPRLVAFGVRGRNPATRRSFLVTEALPESERLSACLAREFARGFAHRRALARALGQLVRALHALPLAHRDLYLEHVFLAHAPHAAAPQLYLLDLHRAAPPRRARAAFVKDLAALYGSAHARGATRTDALAFLAAYQPEPAPEARRTLLRALARRARSSR